MAIYSGAVTVRRYTSERCRWVFLSFPTTCSHFEFLNALDSTSISHPCWMEWKQLLSPWELWKKCHHFTVIFVCQLDIGPRVLLNSSGSPFTHFFFFFWAHYLSALFLLLLFLFYLPMFMSPFFPHSFTLFILLLYLFWKCLLFCYFILSSLLLLFISFSLFFPVFWPHILFFICSISL